MRLDPPVRLDGRCVHCGGPRTVRQNRYSGLAAALDPFCSSACCRAWHGVAEREHQPQGRRGYVSAD